MTLTLVTGPANAAKAGAVLSAYRESLARAGTGAPRPLLVVPTSADVEPYQRELAATGTVFGGEVITFDGLISEMAAVTGTRLRPLGAVAREAVVRAVVREARPVVLARSAASPGFVPAAAALFAELQRSLVTPQRFTSSLRTWAAGAGDRAAYAEEVAALYSAYRRRLEGIGRPDAEGHQWAVLDALRAAPARWGGRPVFFYGFDDLTPLQRDAVEALVRVAGASVTLALAYEPGRRAFAGRAGTVETLRPLAARHHVLPDRSEHYAGASRPALHHLERHLFEGTAPRVAPNGAVRLLESGGERPEAELCGAAVLELLHRDVEPAQIAVLVRDPRQAALLAQVFAAYGIPVAHPRRARLATTRLGGGVLAFARAALPGGTAEDLLRWLRTPGSLPAPEPADLLERLVRRGEVRAAAHGRALYEREALGPPLEALDALRDAARPEAEWPGGFLAVLESELERMWTAPLRRSAAVLPAEAAEDARVAGALRAAAAELEALAEADAALVPGPIEVLAALGEVEVRLGEAAGGVLLADPLGVRARRYRAVFVCGLQDGVFPRHPHPDPFLDDADRAGLAVATGLVLPRHEDVLDHERHLFYAAVSRAEEVLFLSFRTSGEEGDPQVPSPFVDHVRDLFTDELWTGRGRRLLADVTWPASQAPTPGELRRARAAEGIAPDPPPLAGPVSEPVRAALAARETEPARGLEVFASCGTRWLVEHVLRPDRIDPDPEPMRRGSLAHAVLERTLRGLAARTGSARLAPASLEAAREELRAALRELGSTRAGAAARAALRALESDLHRWVEAECEADTGFEPEWLEWSFGTAQDGPPPLVLSREGAAPVAVAVTGRVDRIDVHPVTREAVVRDYKGRTVHPGARWAEENRLQAGLYALAARELLGLSPIAALYQPLAGVDLRARGLVRDGGAVASAAVRTDIVDPERFEEVLDTLRDRALDAAAALRAGAIHACPERCSTRGCAHPGICRAA